MSVIEMENSYHLFMYCSVRTDTFMAANLQVSRAQPICHCSNQFRLLLQYNNDNVGIKYETYTKGSLFLSVIKHLPTSETHPTVTTQLK
jgi:hypothetical protein